jgi:integrase/recombinase XerC
MARTSKPWFWKERKAWYVTINRVRHNLGEDKAAAMTRFHEMMSKGATAPEGSVWSVLCDFLDWTELNRPASYPWYRAALQRFKDGVPNCAIRDLKPADIETWLAGRSDWSSTYRAGTVTAIKRAFNWAVKKQGLAFNPVAGLEKPAGQSRDRVLSEEEFKAILKLATDERFRDLLYLAWHTGARPQELVRIERRHLDNKTIVFPKGEAKGKRRARVLFLTDDCHRIVTKWSKRHPGGPIFRNEDGAPWTSYAISCRFARMKDKLGYKPVLYWFRHSYIHHGLTKGKIDPVTMATLAGHSDLTMIYRVYGHLLKDHAHMHEAARRATGSAASRRRPPAA